VPGWRLIWSDEFEGAAGTAVDPSKWTFDLGNNNGWGNQELEYYTDRTDNAALDGQGHLAITARSEPFGGSSYTSARLKTQGKVTWTYGRFEARVQLPYGQGMWPAFWMLGADITSVSWPACGEVDIFENLGREPAIVHGTMHGPGYSGGAGPTGSTTLPGGARLADDFHVFAVEWEANVIRWYLDDQLYSTKTTADVPAGSSWVFDKPFFVILNVAVGGGWPGNPDATTTFPQQMLVDHVRVYQR
jgi:beta-glucanase (GH16 family)